MRRGGILGNRRAAAGGTGVSRGGAGSGKPCPGRRSRAFAKCPRCPRPLVLHHKPPLNPVISSFHLKKAMRGPRIRCFASFLRGVANGSFFRGISIRLRAIRGPGSQPIPQRAGDGSSPSGDGRMPKARQATQRLQAPHQPPRATAGGPRY